MARNTAIRTQISTERVTHTTSSTIAVTRITPRTLRTARGRNRMACSSDILSSIRLVLDGSQPNQRAVTTSGGQRAPVCSVTRAPEAVFGVTVSFAAVTTTSL